jgi:glutathione S-transferase
MKLYSSPSSPFARKCRVVAHELGIALEIANVSPIGNAELRAVNPLGKVPALIADDGTPIYDSRVICEVLNAQGKGRLFPQGADLARALTVQAAADGIADAAVARIFETRRAPDRQDEATMARYMLAMTSGIDVLARGASRFAAEPTIGEVAAACALSYIDFRYADLAWKGRHAHLAAWYERFGERPAMKATELANL